MDDPPRMEVLCVDMADAGLAGESGRIYATRRTLDGGRLMRPSSAAPWYFETGRTDRRKRPAGGDEKIVVSGLATDAGSRYSRWARLRNFFRGL